MALNVIRNVEKLGIVWLIDSAISPILDAEFERHPNQSSQGLGLHLSHHLTSMDLERNLAYAENGRRLFVEKSSDNEREHLPLARRKPGVTPLELIEFCLSLPYEPVPSDGGPYCAAQDIGVNRFQQKLDRPCPHCPDRRSNVRKSTDEYDGGHTEI